MKVSNCCGDPGTKLFGDVDDGVTYKDVELCGNCLEHCEYVEEEKESTKMFRAFTALQKVIKKENGTR